jgi:hypothetical protein
MRQGGVKQAFGDSIREAGGLRTTYSRSLIARLVFPNVRLVWIGKQKSEGILLLETVTNHEQYATSLLGPDT